MRRVLAAIVALMFRLARRERVRHILIGANLATANLKGQPHVVPICYVFDGALFYTAIDRKPKRVRPERLTRVRNITTTGQAALLMDEYSEDCLAGWIKCSAKIFLIIAFAHCQATRAAGTAAPQ